MRGLLLKDMYVVGKQLKIMLLVILFLSAINTNGVTLLSLIVVGSLPMTSIAYDARAKWDNMAVMMPYSRKQIVTSKYIFGYIGIGSSIIIISIVSNIYSLVRLGTLDYDFFNARFAIELSTGLVFMALNTLTSLKFGTEKGRYLLIIGVVICTIAGNIIKDISKEIVQGGIDITYLSSKIDNIAWLFLVGAVVINIIAITLSIKFKSKH